MRAPFGEVRCVVFDIDDTLYLERDYVRSGFNAVERQSGITGLSGTCWRLFCQGVRGQIFDVALRELALEPTSERVQLLVEVYRSHHPCISLLPDASRCLRGLDGYRLGCITDGPAASQRAKFAALRLAQVVEHVVYTEDLGEGFGKPHPRSFREMEAWTGLAGPEHMYVADNPYKDFQGPISLGWQTVRVQRRGGLWSKVPSALAGANVRELGTLLRLLTT